MTMIDSSITAILRSVENGAVDAGGALVPWGKGVALVKDRAA